MASRRAMASISLSRMSLQHRKIHKQPGNLRNNDINTTRRERGYPSTSRNISTIDAIQIGVVGALSYFPGYDTGTLYTKDMYRVAET
jgi:hypothetical protein